MRTPYFAIGSLLAACGVAAGAIGAHLLEDTLGPDGLELWGTATRYALYGAFGLLAIGVASDRRPGRGWALAGTSLTIGTLVFSGTVLGLAIGSPRWLGAVTPVGGVLMIVGFGAAALAAGRR